MNIKFVNIPINNNDDSHKLIKEHFNYQFNSELYAKYNKNNIPIIYDEIYKYYSNENKDSKIISFSQDPSVSCSIISALNEKYIVRNNDKFSSLLKIIYIDKIPRLNTLNKFENIQDHVISSLFGLTENTICNQKLLLKPDQIIYLGLDENFIPNDQSMLLDELGITYFTFKRIKNKFGLEKIVKFILKECENSPIHLVINLNAFKLKINDDQIENSFDYNDINNLVLNFKNKIKTMDITGYPKLSSDNISDINIAKLIKLFMVEIMDLKEKKINIFTEDTRFLIYRPIEQENSEDIGWYILRFIDLDKREEILNKIKSDEIINLVIEDDNDEEIDIYLSSTTVNEQEQMSYYTAVNILDKCLFPCEKMIMLFELINTPKNIVLHE